MLKCGCPTNFSLSCFEYKAEESLSKRSNDARQTKVRRTFGQIGNRQSKIDNLLALCSPTLRVMLMKAIFGHLFERGERYAGRRTNHCEPYPSGKWALSAYKNWRLGRARIWLLAFGYESTVFAPWPGLPGLSQLRSPAPVQSRKLADEGKSLLRTCEYQQALPD